MHPLLYFDHTLSLNISSLLLLITAAVVALGAARIAFHEGVNAISISFCLVATSIALWLVPFSFMYSANDPIEALQWAKTSYLGLPFLPAALYQFTVSVLPGGRRSRVVARIGWAMAACFSAAILTSGHFIVGVYRYPWGYYPQYGWLSAGYLLFFFGFLAASYYRYWRALRQAVPDSVPYRRIRLFMVALGISYAGIIDYLPKFGLAVYPAGYLAVLIAVVLMLRAVTRYRLVDITPTFAAQTIIDTMQDGLLLVDAEGKIRVVNAATERLLGMPERKLLGEEISAVLGRSASEAVSGQDRISQQGVSVCFEFKPVRDDGRDLVLGLSCSSMRDSAGDLSAYVCILRDLTEMKRTQRALEASREDLEKRVAERTDELRKANDLMAREIVERKRSEEMLLQSEERYRLLTEISPNPVIVADVSGSVVIANRQALAVFCHSHESEVLGRGILEWVHPEDKGKAAAAFGSVLEGGFLTDYTLRLMTADGRPFWSSSNASLVRTSEGEPRFVIIVVTDITERKRSEEELLRTQKLESLGVLAGGIAHDFNNLMQGVFGNITLAKVSLEGGSRSYSLLERAEQALNRSVDLTTQLLTFAKGGLPIKKRLSTGQLVEEAVRFALSGSRTDHRVILDPGLWQVNADGAQLSQAIQNIVLNAHEAMPGGGTVWIEARNRELPPEIDACFPEGGKFVEVSVRDSGRGIAPEYLSKIFDPYFTTKKGGTGLGLATAYSIVRNHGGTIRAVSEEGNGCTVTLVIHAIAEESPLPAPPAAPARVCRVLLMDDEDIVVEVGRILLETLGYTVVCVQEGEEAVRQCRLAKEAGDPFRIAILDLTIKGGMGGEWTVGMLREIDPGLRAVVSSGYSDNPIVSDYLSYGFAASLTKPYDIAMLKDALSRL